ncbi:hypothetical protein DPMN_126414 [Dreissena polymorpha]|uniref:Uncharacterized protein n=1 Tax=Dreissena polymorpha TaxID=45954 RepID=A0A9D4GXA0_DREPO|nr:hypothetical protein DPMN_126414 [Dreissena polymorpha]
MQSLRLGSSVQRKPVVRQLKYIGNACGKAAKVQRQSLWLGSHCTEAKPKVRKLGIGAPVVRQQKYRGKSCGEAAEVQMQRLWLGSRCTEVKSVVRQLKYRCKACD